MASGIQTSPRQVKLLDCRAYAPGMEDRGAIGGYDVSNYISQINIYESIFDNTLSGKVVFTDILGLPEYLPLVGVEYLYLSFSVTVEDTETVFTRLFQIVGLKDQMFVKNEQRLFSVDIVTPEFVQSISGRIQKAYNDTSCSNGIRRVLTEELKVPLNKLNDIRNTTQKTSITIPNFTPLTTINYFTLLALTPQRDSCFLFFETLDGFHFISLAEMFRAQADTVFNVNTGQMSSARTIQAKHAFTSIVRLFQEQSFNLLTDIAGGVLNSQVLHLDFLARKYQYETSNYTDTFAHSAHLTDTNGGQAFPLYPQHFDQMIAKNVKLFTVLSTNWSKDSKYVAKALDVIDEEYVHKAIELRNRQLKTLKHIRTVIEVPGQPDIRAGATVIVNYPSSRPLEDNMDSSSEPVSAKPSPYYSGKHLVTAVRHMLTRTSPANMEYLMHIEVCRDAFSSPLPIYPDSPGQT